MDNLVSIIIPLYNREKTIVAAVNSALQQTYKNIEVIVVDDGSKDQSLEMISTINDERLQIIKLEQNGGASHARNVGIMSAHGEYISFHDSDDLMKPTKIERQISVLKETHADMVYCQVDRFDLSGKHLGQMPTNTRTYSSKERTLKEFLKRGRVWTQAILGTADTIKTVLFDESLKCRVDMDWSIRYSQSYTIVFLREPLVLSYVQTDSISTNSKNQITATDIMYQKYSDIINKDPELKRAWEVEKIRVRMREIGSKECIRAFFLSGDIHWVVRAIRKIKQGK